MMDSESGDAMDAKTTDEMANEKDGENLLYDRRCSSASSRFSSRSRDPDDKCMELH